jgi:eukaryotic-like serine/threonine-protein kinase
LGARASVWLEQSLYAQALADCEAARAIYQALHDADPKDARTSFMLANAIHRIGVVQTRAGRPRAALQEINTALSMREALSAQDPVNAGARAEVAVSLGALGDAQAALGQRARAADSYRRAVALIEDLQLRQQANTEALGELQRVRQRLTALGL